MPQDRHFRLPGWTRPLVWVASRLVAGRARQDWRQNWDSALGNAWILFQRGELSRNELLAVIRRAAVDAWRKSECGQRSPRSVVLASLAVLAVLGIASHGFRATRSLFQPLPVEHPERLVWIQYTGSVGQPMGVPPRLLPTWRAKSTLLTGLAAYSHRPYTASARATTNFFSLLGTWPAHGRLFRAGDRDTAILTDAGWRSLFGADPQVLGKRITMEGRSFAVVGVLPQSFWAVSPRILVWTPLPLDPPGRTVPVLVPAVGRLKPGASLDALRTDLFQAAKAAHQPLPRRPEVVAFTAVTGPLLRWYLLGIGFAIGVALVILSLQQSIRFHHGWRYCRFLLAKTVLLTAIPALAWIESRWSGFMFAVPFLAACSLGFWWSFADQRRRCPECLARLAMPVTMGSWSSVLEPVATEFLCESGHGSLCVPETIAGEPDRWTALDSSWRGLFEKVPSDQR
jgi:hypothetical protein